VEAVRGHGVALPPEKRARMKAILQRLEEAGRPFVSSAEKASRVLLSRILRANAWRTSSSRCRIAFMRARFSGAGPLPCPRTPPPRPA